MATFESDEHETPEEHEAENPTHSVVRKFTATYCKDCDFSVATGPLKLSVKLNDDGTVREV